MNVQHLMCAKIYIGFLFISSPFFMLVMKSTPLFSILHKIWMCINNSHEKVMKHEYLFRDVNKMFQNERLK